MGRALRNAPEWCILNAYALLADVAALGMAFLSYFCWRMHGHLTLFASVCSFVVLVCGAVNLHASYPEKRRIFRTLLWRNRHGLREEAFEGLFDAPCLRLLVRLVLHRIGRDDAYGRLLHRFYVPPWKLDHHREDTCLVFKTPEEGLTWLSQRNNRIF